MQLKPIINLWLIWVFLVLSPMIFFGQSVKEIDGYKIVTGERPAVNYNQLTKEAFEPGLFTLKFSEAFSKQLEQKVLTVGDDGYVKVGLPHFDQLCEDFKVTSATSLLDRLYEMPGKQKDYSKRHKAWGFHLWYDLTTDYKGDIIQLIEAFKTIEGVELVEPRLKIKRIEPVDKQPLPKEGAQGNNRWTPNDPFYSSQWNLENTGQTILGMPGTAGMDINVKPAWDIEKGSPDVVVAVFDGGIKWTHEDIAGNIWPEIGPDGQSSAIDNHATSVAGIIAGVSNNSIGIAGIAGGSGSNDGVRLMSLDFFKEGQPATYEMGLYIWAADNGAAISQNSWGYVNPDAYNTVDLYGIDYFNANGGGDVMEGGITIFAAGNNGDAQNWYPSIYSGVVSVAATDNNGIKAFFSCYNPSIELSAPGLNVPSAGIYNENHY